MSNFNLWTHQNGPFNQNLATLNDDPYTPATIYPTSSSTVATNHQGGLNGIMDTILLEKKVSSPCRPVLPKVKPEKTEYLLHRAPLAAKVEDAQTPKVRFCC